MRTSTPEKAAAIAHYVRTHWGYNPVTGEITGRGGKRIGTKRPDGPLQALAYVDGKAASVLLHRAAWLLVTGAWPEHEIDHDDLDKTNNKWSNLRPATRAENMQNLSAVNCSGRLRGAHPYHNKFKSWIRAYGKSHYLGLFDTEIEAHEAYREGKRRVHTFNPEQKDAAPTRLW